VVLYVFVLGDDGDVSDHGDDGDDGDVGDHPTSELGPRRQRAVNIGAILQRKRETGWLLIFDYERELATEKAVFTTIEAGSTTTRRNLVPAIAMA
jgi:hypothetical protein